MVAARTEPPHDLRTEKLMTPDELNRLKELHATATPAPWYFNPFCPCAEIIDDDNDLVLGLNFARTLVAQERLDATVMVEARNALPGLLEHIDKLTRRLEIYEARLGRLARTHPDAYAEALEGDTPANRCQCPVTPCIKLTFPFLETGDHE